VSYAVELALVNALNGLVNGRVHVPHLPDRPEYPCLLFYLSSSRPENTLCGESTLTHWQYHIDVFAHTHKDAIQLASTVRGVMRRFVYPASPVFSSEGYEPEIKVARYMLEFEISANAEDTAIRAAEVAHQRQRHGARPQRARLQR
jgi:hypothetical protein